MAEIGDNVIHPRSLFIVQLYKSQGTLVGWDIGCED